MTVDARKMQGCFAWSARAWARPFAQFLQQNPGLHVASALEIGAGAKSSLAPLMLTFADQVECSYFDAATCDAIMARNTAYLSAAEAPRVHYAKRDVTALEGRWDMIVMKSVLGGVFRQGHSSLDDVHALIAKLVTENLHPGGILLSLDNGRTVLEPLLQPFGARKNGWRFFKRQDFPPAAEYYGFGLLSAFSASTRLGAWGRVAENLLFGADMLLSPLARQHAVHLHVFRNNAQPVA